MQLKSVHVSLTCLCLVTILFKKSIGRHLYQDLSQKTQNISITFVQRRLTVFDVGPTLYKSYTNFYREVSK